MAETDYRNDSVMFRISVFSDEDYQRLDTCEAFSSLVSQRFDGSKSFIVAENFNSLKCPLCGNENIANVVDDITNKFVNECGGCNLRFITTIC